MDKYEVIEIIEPLARAHPRHFRCVECNKNLTDGKIIVVWLMDEERRAYAHLDCVGSKQPAPAEVQAGRSSAGQEEA